MGGPTPTTWQSDDLASLALAPESFEPAAIAELRAMNAIARGRDINAVHAKSNPILEVTEETIGYPTF